MKTNLNSSLPPLIKGGANHRHTPLISAANFRSPLTRGAGGVKLPSITLPPNPPTKPTQQIGSATTQQRALPAEAPLRYAILTEPNPKTFCRPRTNVGINERVTTALDHSQRHPGHSACGSLNAKGPIKESGIVEHPPGASVDFERSSPGSIPNSSF